MRCCSVLEAFVIHQEARVAQDHREKVVEIMSHSSRQLPERFHLLGLAQLVFQLFAGNELPNLAAHRGEHRQQLVVQRVNLRAEKLDDAQGLLPQLHWNGDGAAQAYLFCQALPREIGLRVGDPRGPAGLPNAARQAFACRKDRLAAPGRELFEFLRRRMPDFDAAQHLGRLVHRPERAHVPLKVLANDLENFLRGLSERGRFGQGPSHGMVCGQSLLGLLPLGDVRPHTDDFPRLAGSIAHRPVLVFDPPVAPVLVPDAVFDIARAVR